MASNTTQLFELFLTETTFIWFQLFSHFVGAIVFGNKKFHDSIFIHGLVQGLKAFFKIRVIYQRVLSSKLLEERAYRVKLVSLELIHFGVIARLFRQIGGHSM